MPNYNHYTPQSDGSYRRSTIQESPRRPTQRQPYTERQQSIPPAPPKEDHPRPPEPPKQSCPPESRPDCPPPSQQPGGDGILSFLRRLLPRQIDAADLLVIVLLLLISRDECGEDDLSPLLTIALYFLL